MIDRRKIEDLVRAALKDALGDEAVAQRPVDRSGALVIPPDCGVNLGVPFDAAALGGLLAAQPARIGVGRTGLGTRYRTNTFLRFRADHAAAKDAAVSEVDPKLLEKLGLFEVRSRATDKRVFLQRPDAGRALSDEARAELGRRCARAPPLQIVCGDGLSAVPLNEHLEPFHRALEQELAAGGVRAGTPFFVRYSRVKIMDEIARLLDAEACLFACGEGATDANREVISNINPRGIEPARAARLTAEAIARILRERKSGVAVQSGA